MKNRQKHYDAMARIARGEIKDANQSIMRIAEALRDAFDDPATEHEQAVRKLAEETKGSELEGDAARAAIGREFDAMKRADDEKRDPDPTGPVDVPAGVKAHPMVPGGTKPHPMVGGGTDFEQPAHGMGGVEAAVGSSPQGDGADR